MKLATLRCTACGRALTAAAVSIPTRNGNLSYGPVCARALKVTRGIYRAPAEGRERMFSPVRRTKAEPAPVPGLPRTVDWIEESEAAA